MLKRIVVAAIALVVLAAATVPAQAQSRRHRTSSRCDRYDRYGNCDDRNYRSHESRSNGSSQNYWLRRATQRTRNVVTDIMDDGDQAMSDIDRRYPRTRRRPITRADRYNPIPVRRVPLFAYVMGRRGPFDSCLYSWNSRGSCRDYQGIRDRIAAGIQTVETERLRSEIRRLNRNLENASRAQELEAIDDTYGTEEREVEVVDQDQQEPVRQTRNEPAAAPRIDPSNTPPKPITILNQTGCKVSVDHVEVAINGDASVTDRSRPPFVEAPATCDKYFKPISADVLALRCR